MSLFFGIAREPVYSPGKVEHDRAILEEVAERLRARHTVRVLDVEAARRERERPDLVFAMCQGPVGLALLRGWEESGIRVVNSAASIVGCQRENMLKAFDTQGVPYPESLSFRLDRAEEPREWGALPQNCKLPLRYWRHGSLSRMGEGEGEGDQIDAESFNSPSPQPSPIRERGQERSDGDFEAKPEWGEDSVWLKRGDVHAVEPADVVFCRGREEVRRALDGFRRRRIASAVLQRHVAGEVIKFYAAPGGFVRCYSSGERSGAPDRARCHQGWIESVDALARRAAAAVGVEVFGGDVVREPDGALWLIDLNDWPSYAPCRSDAAGAIVDFLDEQGRLNKS